MPDGKPSSGGTDSHVRMWLLDGTHEKTSGCAATCAPVVLPGNQPRLWPGDSTVQLFNVNDGAVLAPSPHTDFLNCLVLLPDGLRFVSGSEDKTACIVYHGLAPQ